MNKKINPHKSSIGNMDANIMSIIAYLGGGALSFFPGLYYFSWAVPLVIYIMEKESKFVKKNALQSLVLQIISSLIMFILYVIIGGIIRNSYNGNPWAYISGVYSGLAFIGTIATIISIIFGVIAIIAVIKVYNYEYYSLPLIGKLTKNFGNKLDNIIGSYKTKNKNNEKDKKRD